VGYKKTFKRVNDLMRACAGASTFIFPLKLLTCFLLFLTLLPAVALSAPSIVSVTSSIANGSYKAGAVISININFSEEVTVTGTPRITLETGANDAVVSYSSGSGSNTLTFNYPVVSGHTSSDLDYINQSALALNGGTITNAQGETAVLTLPTPGAIGSLGANSDIRIDTTAPTVSISLLTPSVTNTLPIRVQVTFSEAVTGFNAFDPTVTNGEVIGFSGSGASYTIDVTAYADGDVTVQIPASSSFDAALNGNTVSTILTARYDTQPSTVTGITASPTSGAYRATQQITLLVNFSEAVTVSGVPSFTVETGASDGVATYISGSGTAQLAFRYTVQSGQTSADLDYTATDTLVLNGGSIRDAATNNSVLTFPTPGAAGSLSANANIIVDTTLPDVTITSPISGDTSLDAIPVVVTFSESVSGFTLSDFSVTNGCASNLRGSGSTYYADIVPRANGAVIVTIPSSIAVDIAGNPNTAAPTPVNVNFFTLGPKVTTVTSSTPDGAYRAGQTISIQIAFSDPVTVTGLPQLRLATGSIGTAVYSSGSGTNTLTFDYTIASGQNSNDLDYIPLPPITLNGGTIRDLSTDSYDAAFTFACQGTSGSLAASKNIIIDTVAPTISRITSTTNNGAYRAGQTLNIRAQFSENVFVTGTPNITLETGPNDAVVSMVSGSGSANLDFSYTIVDGHNSSRLDYTATSAFNPNGATIIDQAGNVAVVTLPSPGTANSLAGTKNLIVDTIPPTVPNVSSTTANGAYKAGTTINVQVAFSENIFVTLTPRIALATGMPNRYATYSSGSGTSILNFSYTVAAGDTTSDLDYTGTSALETNGGTIRDQAGNDSIVTLASPGAQFSLSFNKNIQLDTTAPTILSVSSSVANGFYTAGANIPITVAFSEAVNVVGTPTLTLNTSPIQSTATYLSGSGTSLLTFIYTVTAGHNSTDLDYISSAALSLPAGSNIRDPATNAATLTLPNPGTSGSLGAQGDRIIDTVMPRLTSIAFATPNGFYRAGQDLQIDLTFSEVVSLIGSLKLQLATNSAQGLATCSTILSANTIRCTYTIASGDNSNDLDYLTSTSLTLGSGSSALIDLAGNSADLTLPNPGDPLSLSGQSAVVVDTTAPVATLTSTTQNVTNVNPIPVTIAFSEVVTGLDLGDFLITNGTAQNLLGSGANYTVELVPQGQGIAQISIKNSAVLDLAGNTNPSSLTVQRTYDSVRPSVRIDSSSAETSNTNLIPASITFSEAVTGFTASDITITNGTIASLTGSGANYAIEIAPNTDGAVELFIAQNIAFDSGGNGNLSSDTLSRFFDSTPPQILSVNSDTSDGHYRVGATLSIKVICSEPVFVTGSPRLALNLGATPAWATYIGGSETNTLSFTYTITAGNNSSDLDYPDVGALRLEGGSIKDLATNSAAAILPPPGSPNSLGGQRNIIVDTQAPTGTLISEPASSAIIKRAHLEIKGLAEAGSSVTITNSKNIELCNTTTASSGFWICPVSGLDDGAYQIRSIAKDQAGNQSAPSNLVTFIIDLLALDSPTFLEPLNGGSTESQPIFSGTAPPNKKVRVKRGSSTLCLADVTSAGSWSCQSTEVLSAGRYEISGTTEDPNDLTTSSATTLNLVIGLRLKGVVLLANRDLTPLEGVEIKDHDLSLKTDTTGSFSWITPDKDSPKVTLSKFGWRIERSTTLSDRARQLQADLQWLATPALEKEVYAIWGGTSSLKQGIRILNSSSQMGQAKISVLKNDGSLCNQLSSAEITPNNSAILDLSQNDCSTSSGYGLIRVTFSQSEYDGALLTSSSGTGIDRWLSSYNELPLANTVTGKTYVPFDNSYRASRKGSERLVRRNDLLVANPTSAIASFTVKRYSARGALIKTRTFSIPPMGSYQVPFDDSEENVATSGLEEIEPSDPTARYIAIMLRSGASLNQTNKLTGRFIQSNYSESGFGQTFFSRVRYTPIRYAIQYMEISNISSRPSNVLIKRIDSKGRVRPTIPLFLKPLQTRRIRLSRLLDKYEEGVAEITSDTNSSLMINNVMKHYKSYNQLISMKSSTIYETYGDLLYGTYDSARSMRSLLKVSNLGNNTTSATISCYSDSTLLDSTTLTLKAGQLKEIDLKTCFGKIQRGTVEVNSSTPGALVADILRFRSSEDISLRERLR
jgi:hypothetical protein